MTEQDLKPWHQQFWPWFIICLLGSSVAGSLYTVSLAVRTTDSLVVTSDDGMDVVAERHLAAEGFATELGLKARISIDMGSGAIVATVTSEAATDWPQTIDLLLSHPAFARRDQTITLTAAIPDSDGNPTWSGHFVDVPSGRFYLVLKSGDAWRLNGTWSGESTTYLVPASANGDGGS